MACVFGWRVSALPDIRQRCDPREACFHRSWVSGLKAACILGLSSWLRCWRVLATTDGDRRLGGCPWGTRAAGIVGVAPLERCERFWGAGVSS